MNSKIVEYKQRYFEVDDEVEGELIITQNRHNVVVDFLNNYPELWEIIYKFKSLMEDKDKRNHFINCMKWEIAFINTLNVEKMISSWNDLAYRDCELVIGKDYKQFTDFRDGENQIQDFRFQLFLTILGKRTGVSMYRGKGWREYHYQPLLGLEEKPQYKDGKLYQKIFSKNTLRKIDLGYFSPLCKYDDNFNQFKDDIIELLEKHYKEDGIIDYPLYDDCVFGNEDEGQLGLRGGDWHTEYYGIKRQNIPYRYYRDMKPFNEEDLNLYKNFDKSIYSRLHGWGETSFFEDYKVNARDLAINQ